MTMPGFRYIIIFSAVLLISGTADKKIDDFALFNVHGKRHTFYGLLDTLPDEGLLIINFTSIGCKPCMLETPELLDIEKLSAGRSKLIFVYAECCSPVIDKASSLGALGKSFVDPFGKIRGIFQVKNFPVTFIVGKNQRIKARFDGYTKSNVDSIRRAVLSEIK